MTTLMSIFAAADTALPNNLQAARLRAALVAWMRAGGHDPDKGAILVLPLRTFRSMSDILPKFCQGRRGLARPTIVTSFSDPILGSNP